MRPAGARRVLGMLHKQVTSELGTSETTVKIHREDGSEFYGSASETPLLDEMRKLLDPLLFTPERSIKL
jgi:FixJ family two-component response regulator